MSAFKNTTSSSLACVAVALLSGAFKSSEKCPTERLCVCIFFSRVIHVTAAVVIRIRIEHAVRHPDERDGSQSHRFSPGVPVRNVSFIQNIILEAD